MCSVVVKLHLKYEIFICNLTTLYTNVEYYKYKLKFMKERGKKNMRTLKKNVALLIALAMLLTAVFPAFATQSAFIAGGRSYDSVADLLEALRSRTITYSQVYEYDSEVGYRNVEELDVAEFEAINVLADEEGKDFNDIIGDIASYTERLQAEISTREAEVQVKTAEELLDELEVIEVSAITETVLDGTADQYLEFTVNDGVEVTMEELDEAGYSVEFQANKLVLDDGDRKSVV